MIKIFPQGSNLLINPISKENYKTDSGIEIVDIVLAQGEVMEVSEEYSTIYKKGDIVMYSETAGITQPYNGKLCIWLNGKPVNDGGNVCCVVTDEK